MIVDLHTHLVNYKTDFTEPFYSDLVRCGISSKEWDYTQQEYLEGTAAADRVVVMRAGRCIADVMTASSSPEAIHTMILQQESEER